MKYLTYYENGEIISTEDYKEAVKKLERKNRKETVQKFILHKYIFAFFLDEVEDPSQYSLCEKRGTVWRFTWRRKTPKGI